MLVRMHRMRQNVRNTTSQESLPMCHWQFPIVGLENIDVAVKRTCSSAQLSSLLNWPTLNWFIQIKTSRLTWYIQADDHKLELLEIDVWLDQSKLPTGYQCPDMSHNFTSLLETTNLLKPLHQDTHCTSNDKSMEDQRARAYSVGVYH